MEKHFAGRKDYHYLHTTEQGRRFTGDLSKGRAKFSEVPEILKDRVTRVRTKVFTGRGNKARI